MTLRDYLDYIEPIPGQPGLFRQERTLSSPNAWDESGFEVVASRAPAPRPLRGTQTNTVGLACGCTGPKPLQGLRGLGSVSMATRLNNDWERYLGLKDELHRLFVRYPGALEPMTFEAFVTRLVQLRPSSDTLVRMTAEQLAMLLKGGLSVVVSNLGLAYSMTSARRATDRAKLVDTAERVMDAIRRMLDALQTAQEGARAVGLGELGIAIADDVIIAGIAVVGVVIIAGLVIAFLSQLAAAIEAHHAAEVACERDAAAGHPCTGAEGERYRSQARADAASYGVAPAIGDALRPLTEAAGSLLFWAGVGVAGYLLWTTLPAATETRENLRRRAASYR
jgi:hypothetical protein